MAKDFGSGRTDDGRNYHEWPIGLFVRHFKGVETDDDWKAVIYAWGGPLPRFIESTALEHKPDRGTVRIFFSLKDGTSSEDWLRGHTRY